MFQAHTDIGACTGDLETLPSLSMMTVFYPIPPASCGFSSYLTTSSKIILVSLVLYQRTDKIHTLFFFLCSLVCHNFVSNFFIFGPVRRDNYYSHFRINSEVLLHHIKITILKILWCQMNICKSKNKKYPCKKITQITPVRTNLSSYSSSVHHGELQSVWKSRMRELRRA